jgi:hypothetical protein
MVQVVVSWTELSLRRNPEGARDFRVETEAAFPPLGAANIERTCPQRTCSRASGIFRSEGEVDKCSEPL